MSYKREKVILTIVVLNIRPIKVLILFLEQCSNTISEMRTVYVLYNNDYFIYYCLIQQVVHIVFRCI